MDAMQKRIRTLQTDIENMDQVDEIVLRDIGGHTIIELDSIDVQAVKQFLDNRYLKEIENHRHTQRMVAWTSQAIREGIVQ